MLPCLATLRIGNRASDLSYIKSIDRVMDSAHILVRHVALSETVSTNEVVEAMQQLAKDPSVHGLLLLQPLPRAIEIERVKEAIDPRKDVDGTTMMQLGRFAPTEEVSFPIAPTAVLEMLDFHGIDLNDKKVVIIGSGAVVGRPLATLLNQRLAKITTIDRGTKNMHATVRQADIVVAAAGVAGLIDASCVRPGQILIDVGLSMKNGQLRGDVDWDAVAPIVQAATPTPGGIGSITTHLLALRVLQAADKLDQSGGIEE